MAAAPHTEQSPDPVLRHPSRLGLLTWFVVQWILIPVDFIARTLWLLVLFFGDGTPDQLLRLLDPPSRFLSPGKLLVRMSHNPAKHEAYLDREFARLAQEIDRGKFSWRTRVFYGVAHEVHSDGYLYRIGVHPREYRGVPLSTLNRLASPHALTVEASSDLKHGVALRPAHVKDSW
ncbi:hypothetical protein E0500_018890 [Streptomyces sp. KM273126]|uniref:hypothetical protein n=1 Tax=Streptomyces sp. KM273126 TaxID=2545247 RepID=UPI0010390A8F|nr:hypothetical protein [Streptomyces sp. KM273126]MBA2809408.1 hypothetical protein [Streptomyces sp. KM273126]